MVITHTKDFNHQAPTTHIHPHITLTTAHPIRTMQAQVIAMVMHIAIMDIDLIYQENYLSNLLIINNCRIMHMHRYMYVKIYIF